MQDVVHIVDGFLESNFLHIDLLELAAQLNLTSALYWIRQSGSEAIAASSSGYAVLAPSNDADASLDHLVRERMMTNPPYLLSVILSHVLSDPHSLASLRLRDGGFVGGYLNQQLSVDVVKDGTVSLSLRDRTAKIVLGDQLARNGIIHVLDNFLLPE